MASSVHVITDGSWLRRVTLQVTGFNKVLLKFSDSTGERLLNTAELDGAQLAFLSMALRAVLDNNANRKQDERFHFNEKFDVHYMYFPGLEQLLGRPQKHVQFKFDAHTNNHIYHSFTFESVELMLSAMEVVLNELNQQPRNSNAAAIAFAFAMKRYKAAQAVAQEADAALNTAKALNEAARTAVVNAQAEKDAAWEAYLAIAEG